MVAIRQMQLRQSDMSPQQKVRGIRNILTNLAVVFVNRIILLVRYSIIMKPESAPSPSPIAPTTLLGYGGTYGTVKPCGANEQVLFILYCKNSTKFDSHIFRFFEYIH